MFVKCSVLKELLEFEVVLLLVDEELLIEAADNGRCFDEGDPVVGFASGSIFRAGSFGDCVGELISLFGKSFARE